MAKGRGVQVHRERGRGNHLVTIPTREGKDHRKREDDETSNSYKRELVDNILTLILALISTTIFNLTTTVVTYKLKGTRPTLIIYTIF